MVENLSPDPLDSRVVSAAINAISGRERELCARAAASANVRIARAPQPKPVLVFSFRRAGIYALAAAALAVISGAALLVGPGDSADSGLATPPLISRSVADLDIAQRYFLIGGAPGRARELTAGYSEFTDAIDNVEPRGTIAIAGGTLDSAIVIDKPVRLASAKRI